MKLESIITYIFILLIVVDQVSLRKPQQKQVEENKPKEDIEQPVIQSDEEQKYPEENNQDQQREYKNQIPIIIDIQYCNRTSHHEAYREVEKVILKRYPQLNIEIIPSQYPVPEINQQIAQLFQYGQYGLMALLFFYKQLFGMLGIPVKPIFDKIAEKKMFVLMGFLFANTMIQNKMLTTGGFRVTADSNLIYDQIGQVNLEAVTNLLSQFINNNIKL
ncbi:hypothetical protein pb186bvf_007477 [Paramecium bursaria]